VVFGEGELPAAVQDAGEPAVGHVAVDLLVELLPKARNRNGKMLEGEGEMFIRGH
jgi:hypothetical protein